jgi:hypothetical protein
MIGMHWKRLLYTASCMASSRLGAYATSRRSATAPPDTAVVPARVVDTNAASDGTAAHVPVQSSSLRGDAPANR